MLGFAYPNRLRLWLSAIFLLIPLCLGAADTQKVLILGDSLTEGYGIDPSAAFPAMLEKRLHEKGFSTVTVLNGGISGSTTAGAVSRLRWHLKAKPNVLVLCLGANDGLRGLPVAPTKKNLSDTIALAKVNGLSVILAGMKLPKNYGAEYNRSFQKMYVDLAEEHELSFLPFLLEGVAGQAELNLSDGIHPNEKGHARVADNVLPYVLKKL